MTFSGFKKKFIFQKLFAFFFLTTINITTTTGKTNKMLAVNDVSLCEIRKRRSHYKRLKEVYFNRELFAEYDRLSKYIILSEIVGLSK
jgi:hypothetical protein